MLSIQNKLKGAKCLVIIELSRDIIERKTALPYTFLNELI